MSNQSKKSFKQILASEYKIIMLFTFVVILIPLVTQIIIISDLSEFRNLTILEKIGVLLQTNDFQFTDITILSYLSYAVTLVSIPLFAAIFAFKLNGERLLVSIKNGFKAVGSKRFWNYILKVYLPILLIGVLCYIGLALISDVTYLSAFAKIINSTVLTIAVLFMLTIVSIFVSSILGAVFIVNVSYLRGTDRIKDVFNNLKDRQVAKLIGFNSVQFLISFSLALAFIIPVNMMDPKTLITSIIPLIIGILTATAIFQVVFTYLRFALYMNIASIVEVTLVGETKYIGQNQAITSNTIVTPTNTNDQDPFAQK